MTTKELFIKAAQDAELAGKLQKAASPEDLYALAKEAGVTDSFEDFKAAAVEIKNSAEKLSPAEVDAVVGGASHTETTALTVTVVPAGASAAAGV